MSAVLAWDMTAGDMLPAWRAVLEDEFPGMLDLTKDPTVEVTVTFQNVDTLATPIVEQYCDLDEDATNEVIYDFTKHGTIDVPGDYQAMFTVWWGGKAASQPETFPTGGALYVLVRPRLVAPLTS